MQLRDLREQCVVANQQLQSAGLIDLTFGNASILDVDTGIFAIKPSGVPYAELTAGRMVLVDLQGAIVDGTLRPSSDEPTHRRLFQAFAANGIRSVVHTHSRNAVAFAQAGMAIPCMGTTHSDYCNGPVPVTRCMSEAEVNGAYEWETGNVIVETLAGADPCAFPAVLVRHHGPFAWGNSGAKAVENAIALEAIADIAHKTFALCGNITAVPDYLRLRHFCRKHGSTAYYGQA